MEESYIRGVNSELIRVIKKLLGSTQTSQDNTIQAINSLGQKLDTIAQNQQEINITADTINLNTDELENKLDSIYSSLSNINEDINNIKIKQYYLNPTHLGIVSEGDTELGKNVVLCNITDSNITVSVTAADDTAAQSIVLTPGWNPVIVKAITGATANTLIYGW